MNVKIFLVCLVALWQARVAAQELFVYTEPASNMPSKSISGKLTAHLVGNSWDGKDISQRYMPEVMFGIDKNLMVHLSATFADMHTNEFRFESLSTYVKYRFLSRDEIHRHFRMAIFADASYTKAPFHYDEISLMGDKSGVEAGLIATQLWHKFALSGIISHTQVLDESRTNKVLYVPARNYQSLNYSLSAGYLVLPRKYTDYRQTNFNIYTELLGQQTLDRRRFYLDIAPSVQFIFNSNTKLNVGRRFQLNGNMERMATSSWLISFERTFLNALR